VRLDVPLAEGVGEGVGVREDDPVRDWLRVCEALGVDDSDADPVSLML
jgi:hypothetical protein